MAQEVSVSRLHHPCPVTARVVAMFAYKSAKSLSTLSKFCRQDHQGDQVELASEHVLQCPHQTFQGSVHLQVNLGGRRKSKGLLRLSRHRLWPSVSSRSVGRLSWHQGSERARRGLVRASHRTRVVHWSSRRHTLRQPPHSLCRSLPRFLLSASIFFSSRASSSCSRTMLTDCASVARMYLAWASFRSHMLTQFGLYHPEEVIRKPPQ